MVPKHSTHFQTHQVWQEYTALFQTAGFGLRNLKSLPTSRPNGGAARAETRGSSVPERSTAVILTGSTQFLFGGEHEVSLGSHGDDPMIQHDDVRNQP